MNKIYYFDHAATTPIREDVFKEMIPFLNLNYGNPSSIYTIGRHNKKIIEESRLKIANIIGAKKAREICFTSCGSESDNLAIKGIAYANKEKGKHIITTKIEHPAVLHTCQHLENEGFEVTYLNVDEEGKINIKDLINSIKHDTILISIMFANNEIGTIQPIKEIGKIANEYNIYFHTDAVQAMGNIKINVEEMNIDLLSMSAHKFYGPKGMGALYIKEGVKIDKIQDGGHQEYDRRAGTENVPGIVGMAKALELADKELKIYNEKLTYLRNYFISELTKKISYIKLNGHKDDRLPGNVNISFKYIDAEALLLYLDKLGICASSGSACSSGSSMPSHVLTAIGLSNEMAYGSLRVTFGRDNTIDEVDYLIDNLVKIVNALREKSPIYKDFINNKE